ncbi:unnamed protein product [Owenia fusiformis]|uniref:Uncharacterized protein n=1 Tax=Owenia fusiformis TaxID=6347 RepID=A0A8J1U7G0_OWEFU|nr:unnamed protein product [Owenia fusiformis]
MAPPVSTIEEEDTCVTTGETSQSDTGVEDVEEDDIKEDLRLIKEATLEPVIDSKEETTSEEQKETDKENTDVSETKVAPKKKNKFRPYKGRINSASYKYMHQSLEDTERMYREYETVVPTPEEPSEKQKTMPASCQSIVKSVISASKVQAGRPPGTRDVQYDEVGNVIGVVKINRNKLPSHRVKTRYHVVDPAVEAAQARLEAMRTGKFLDKHQKAKKIAPVIITAPSVPASEFYTSTVGAPVSTRMTGTTTMSKYDGKRGAVTPLPPPLIESMEVQPGVVVREGNRIKKGPRTYRKGVNIMLDNASVMQPVTMQAGMPLISAAQILEHQTPLVRPLGSAGVIPPIKMTPHPPSRAQVN